ncbi:cache domain-containing protein [Candidatus Venteria ishoeyi]|uniref:Methyl-accepting chemotaxis protein 4 n=1 Tax=Candidatus Venteria ishoeyi TaxID=1899563 RepID=A0A1H6FGH8_9GAMM|nr:cache domain-containing protein [Candidatus Venteria ishoeyi]SEH08449.1 Methyl-accepting chemotaxis protein 4 [Candidatus Venteria ishoeyi]
MKKTYVLLSSALLALGLNSATWAATADMATPDEAKALSEKAAAAVNDTGKEKAFAAFADNKAGFLEKDLYVFCMDMQGVMLSHAKKPQLVGKNLLEFNKYGDFLFKNMIKTAKSEATAGWVDYKWPYPGSEEIRDKTSYVVTNKEGFFCGVGAYK